MELLNKTDINALLESDEPDSLYIDPLLDANSQIGEVTIDLRLGYDFLVSIMTRKPYVAVSGSDSDFRSISSYFQKTRREVGEKFVLYPNQVVLTTTLEYVSLPSNVYADILSRSSYTRLGIHINTMVQPGFRGSIPIELFNHSNNAIELVVGSRIFQSRLFRVENNADYFSIERPRKYLGNVRPTASKANHDSDIDVFNKY